MIKLKKFSRSAVISGLLLVLTGAAAATEKPISDIIRNDLHQVIKTEKKIQEMNADWSDTSKALKDKLENLESEAAHLKKKLEKTNLRLSMEITRLEENRRLENETRRIQAELDQLLDTVLFRLASAIDSDLPFLNEERQGRQADLKLMMVDPKISSAEKFRRVFEALQVETEYGSTVEVTQASVKLDHVAVLVDVLRVGRLALICQTIDRKKSAIFNPTQKNWQLLPGKINRDIGRAIAMARLERSIELVKLPLGRIWVQ